MPSERDHLAMAEHNQKVMDFLLTSPDDSGDWVTTVAFYKALHLVEALFAHDGTIAHGRDHQTRERVLKRENRYQHIYKHYRVLKEASCIARYLSDYAGKVYRRFADYCPRDKVESEFIRGRLAQIQKSVRNLLGESGRAGPRQT